MRELMVISGITSERVLGVSCCSITVTCVSRVALVIKHLAARVTRATKVIRIIMLTQFQVVQATDRIIRASGVIRVI